MHAGVRYLESEHGYNATIAISSHLLFLQQLANHLNAEKADYKGNARDWQNQVNVISWRIKVSCF